MLKLVPPQPQLHSIRERVRKRVDAEFDRLLRRPSGLASRLYEAMHYGVGGGGKRLRPLLVIASGQLFGVPEERSLRAGLAVEAIHAHSLIHDDLPCMDDDDLRRGKPTVHRAFGEATAVLAGDCFHDLAFEIIADPATHEDPFVRAELVLEMARASGPQGMAGGQMLDLVAEGQALDIGSITRLQQLKTGALIEFAVEAACIMGRLPPDARTPYRGYARDVGLAFQIADDLLDFAGDEAAAGKRLRKDLAAGKATFVSVFGAERAKQQAGLLVSQAIEHLADHGEEADLLRALARFAIERNH